MTEAQKKEVLSAGIGTDTRESATFNSKVGVYNRSKSSGLLRAKIKTKKGSCSESAGGFVSIRGGK